MIRRATEADIPAILALSDVCYPEDRDDPTTPVRQSRVIRNNPTWVIEEGGGINAVLVSEISENRPYVWSVCTSPAQRGRGYAKTLLEEFEKHYKAEGYTHFWLHVRTENPAQKLYFDCGFRVASFERNLYGVGAHGMVMRKRI